MPEPDLLYFEDDGRTPNNAWPVIIHHRDDLGADPAAALEWLLNDNAWPAQWRGGVFDCHHYHSNAHEVLAVAHGSARLMLGGEQGEALTVAAGDIVILPAGTGHCRLSADADFLLVAGYPPNQQDWDLCRSDSADIQAARRRIADADKPATDPVTGASGGLCSAWVSSGSESRSERHGSANGREGA